MPKNVRKLLLLHEGMLWRVGAACGKVVKQRLLKNSLRESELDIQPSNIVTDYGYVANAKVIAATLVGA